MINPRFFDEYLYTLAAEALGIPIELLKEKIYIEWEPLLKLEGD